MKIIPVIAIDTYTTYKLAIMLIHFLKQEDNVIVRFSKELSVVEAFVSILILLQELIMINGGINSYILIVSVTSSLVILFVVMLYSVINLIKTIKNN